MIIINYCVALVALATRKVNNDPYLVSLCVTDNTSALNWTLHTSKKSIIGWALARFFCGLLIGLQVGINAKWISTIKNVIVDKISRLKRTNKISPSSSTYELTYNYSNYQQEHEELKACNFFQPSPKLLSLIWEILLTQRCPDLSLILSLKLHDLGKLCTWTSQRIIASPTLAETNQVMNKSLHVSSKNSCWITTHEVRPYEDMSRV